jgi:hypothetical protein
MLSPNRLGDQASTPWHRYLPKKHSSKEQAPCPQKQTQRVPCPVADFFVCEGIGPGDVAMEIRAGDPNGALRASAIVPKASMPTGEPADLACR